MFGAGGTPRHASLTCADLISCSFSQENTRAAERPESAAIDKPMLAERKRQCERPQTTVCVCVALTAPITCVCTSLHRLHRLCVFIDVFLDTFVQSRVFFSQTSSAFIQMCERQTGF